MRGYKVSGIGAASRIYLTALTRKYGMEHPLILYMYHIFYLDGCNTRLSELKKMEQLFQMFWNKKLEEED